MRHGLGLGLAITRASVVRHRPIRVAQYMAYPAAFRTQATSSRRAFIARVPIYIGSCDWSSLRLMLHGWYAGGTSLGNSYTVTKAALELSGSYKAVTFGGAAGLTVADGATEVMSDVITPAPLWAGNVLRHSVPYLRLEGYIDSPTGYFAGGVYAAFNSAASWTYNPDTTTPLSSAYGTGAINTTGLSVYGYAEIPIPVMVVGTPAGNEAAVLMGVGDSIVYGIGGAALFGADADNGGWFLRSLRTAGKAVYNSGLYAGLNCGLSGYMQAQIKSRPKLLSLAKYCNLVIDEGVINGIADVSACISDTRAIWASLASYGISPDRIIRSYITPRTTSSNSFVDAAGQTYATYHGVGGNADTFNAFVDTALANGEFAAIMPMASIRDPGDFRKWLTTGVANAITTDGLHPGSTATHDLLTTEFLGVWRPLAAAKGLWNG